MTTAALLFVPFVSYVFIFIRLNFLNVYTYTSRHDPFSNGTSDIFYPARNQAVLYFNLFQLNCFGLLIFLPYAELLGPGVLSVLDDMYLLFVTAVLLSRTLLKVFLNLFCKTSENYYGALTVFVQLAFCVIFVNTLCTFYILIEVIAYFNLFVLCLHLGQRPQSLKSYQVVTTMLFIFLLNFFSSILIYISLISMTYQFSYPTFSNLAHNFFQNYYSELWHIIAFVKLGLGPWSIGVINSYVGYPFRYLLIYSSLNSLVITPLFIWIISFSYSIPLVTVFNLIFFYCLTTFIGNTFSLKSVLAISTSLIHCYVLLLLLF